MMRMMVTMLGMVLAIGLARPSPAADAVGAHAFAFTSIEGQALPMASFTGRPVLVVNTASLCGFTYQYAALQRLSDAYRAQGLIVLGVPSNDFGGQEPGTAGQIKTFCTSNFDIDFPLTEKVHVRGAQSHPLFVWLRDRLGPTAGPTWNFHKYLIAPDGNVVGFWPSSIEPDSPQITTAIDKLLPPHS